ncbi:hypothetical protein L249_1365 [Ophiocordyceps polyrhachis-furcata BCC 54312]|uniref:Protein kinase domain-containing protein n=1 Tax=Ophiocordyceps polyrhachis-furcata BCC 54312 TaxID=1330021 RepID=A0A367KZ05_9HYPO|nr:hypothetical protein L249_1365 [Ophiocordyceps polyrhachis-furcata BCC 54312]
MQRTCHRLLRSSSEARLPRSPQMSLRLLRRTLSSRATTVGFSPSRSTRKLRSFIHSSYSYYSHTAMSPQPVQYGIVEGVECLYGYQQGGFHPVHINDRLHQRYRIVHKLGYGGFSTVWLAVDEKTAKYVAIKVGAAYADDKESDILSRISQSSTSSCSTGQDKPSLLPVVLDRFQVCGPNGTHTCLVTLPARASLRDVKDPPGPCLFQLDVARSLAGQLAIAVSLVHAAGYAHGDLHLGNLLLQMPSSLNALSIEQLYERYGQPRREPIVRLDSGAAATTESPEAPSYAVIPLWSGLRCNDLTLDDAKIMLIDFGVAFRPSDKSRFESNSPLVLRPPEPIFEPTTPLTYSADIWSLGCLFFELLAHRTLIDGYYLVYQDMVTSQQVELQGLMPPEWWAKWEARPKWYDEAGRTIHPPCDFWPWDRRFEEWVQRPRQIHEMGTIPQDELDALLDLLKWMLAWRPSERPDIKEVLESKMEPIGRHLQTIQQHAQEFQSAFPLIDRFPPSFAPADGPQMAKFIAPFMSYYYTTKVFVKRQPHQDELGLDMYGNPVIYPYIADRLRNEAAVLQFIAKHTTIPVPALLDLWEDNGLVYLKTALVRDGIELRHVDEALLSTATESVTAQLESDIFPQLRRLRRNFMGSPDLKLPVIPPRRLWDWKEKRVWPSMMKDTDDYVFCHTDLDRQNILVDPNTFKIVSILDWETAGFFPQEWDLPFWTANGPQERRQMSVQAKRREMALFEFPGTSPDSALV